MKHLRTSVLLIAATFYAAPGLAELPAFNDSLLLSIATGTEQPLTRAPSVATIITAEQIRNMGATKLSQVLDTVPGIHVYPLAYIGMQPAYSIRGIHTGGAAELLFMRNGIPIQQPTSGGPFNAFDMHTQDIARLEIIRGPGSAVYGADAFSGVVNIITKDANDLNGNHTGIRSGSFDSQQAWLQHGGHYGDWELAFNLDVGKTDGDRSRIIERDLQNSLDKTFNTTASLAPGPLATGGETLNSYLNLKHGAWSVDLWRWQVRDSGNGANATYALDPNAVGSEDYSSSQIALEYQEQLTTDWSFNTHLSYSVQELRRRYMLFPPGAKLPINSDGNVDFANPVGLVTFTDGMHGYPSADMATREFETSSIFEGFTNQRWRLGIGSTHISARGYSHKNFGKGIIDGTQPVVDGTLTYIDGGPSHFYDTPKKERNRWHVSLQDEWQFLPDWMLTAGLRYDRYSDFGSTTNPRAALVWATRHNLTTKLLYGEAFRAPSFNELYLINNPSTWGDPNLNPVTINTTELMVIYEPTFDLHTIANLYQYDIDDAIVYRTDPSANVNRATNLGGQQGHGLELEAQWQISRPLRLDANANWQQAEYELSGADVADAPARQLFVAAFWQMTSAWSLYGQSKWVSHRQRPVGDGRDRIADHTLTNLSLRYQASQGWHSALLVKNLFDREAFDPNNGPGKDDFPREGRSVMLELGTEF